MYGILEMMKMLKNYKNYMKFTTYQSKRLFRSHSFDTNKICF